MPEAETTEAPAPPPPSLSTGGLNLIRRFVAADLKRRKMETDAKEAKAERDRLGEEVQKVFLDNNVLSMRVDGCTVYLTETLWAKRGEGLDAPALCQLLRDHDLGDFVTDGYNTQQLSKWLRELPRDDDTHQPLVPDGLVGKLSASFVKDVRVRRS